MYRKKSRVFSRILLDGRNFTLFFIFSGEHDFIGEFYTNLDEMAEGEGFQIVTWDVINPEKSAKRAKKGEDYDNSGTVILKSINIDRVRILKEHILFP